MQLRWLAVLLLVSSSWAASFDKPVRTRTVDLGASQFSSGVRAHVRCYYFSSFMVKEVDLGEKGASRLAIVPAGKAKLPRCTQAKDKTENVIDPDEWSGYFKGVKGDYVFFDADDGVNGGMGFAVYDARSGRKIFSDTAHGALSLLARADHELVVMYERLVEAECVIQPGHSECWEQIRKDLGLENAGPPDCKSGYEKSAQSLARGRCQAQNANNAECMEKEIALARKQTEESPSVIAYPAEVVLGGKPAVRPVGTEVRCWAAD